MLRAVWGDDARHGLRIEQLCLRLKYSERVLKVEGIRVLAGRHGRRTFANDADGEEDLRKKVWPSSSLLSHWVKPQCQSGTARYPGPDSGDQAGGSQDFGRPIFAFMFVLREPTFGTQGFQ